MNSSVERNLSFCVYIVPFLCISLMYLFTEFSTFTMFLISCHALFLHPEVIDEENFAFKITFLFSPTIQLFLYLFNLVASVKTFFIFNSHK